MHIRDTDFMTELDAAANMRPAKSALFLLYLIVGLVVLFFIWAGFSKVEVISHGHGQVVPSREIQVVQSLEGGILQEILVKEGELVEKGQILARISDVQFSSEERGTEAKFLSLSAKKARLEAEAKGEDYTPPAEVSEKAPRIAGNEKALYESRQKELANAHEILDQKISKAEADLAELKSQMDASRENKKLLEEELKITQEMVRQKAAPKLEEIRLSRELADVSGGIAAGEQKQLSLEAELASARREREGQGDKFRSEALSELNAVEAEMSGLEEDLKSIGDRVDRTELRSPVEGVVNSIALTTIGGVVEPAMRLVEIVPVDDELKVVAKVPPNEIAFIKLGQEAKVKISAYNPQKYGALHGHLVRIGANSVTDQEGNVTFEIEVRTNKNYLGDEENPLPITPGMVADVEVITGKRSILEYLMKPLLRARDRAFTEQ
ncbi:MAG: HlyD family type I secretion periplasmic adaptor subunit [Alphaproteobacteria bacterium]|nr:HlyD family type I secretion periplasmic adaptor subunit [Alphaproteobacteria bacterium]MCD8570011.1 HlyD family type I secretion periplasmic adaptor subunit [Alphaproteobacteria bacterium]